MVRTALDATTPGENEAAIARDALVRVKEFLRSHPGDEHEPVLVTVQEDAERLALPRSAIELMARILAHMAAGQSVSVVPLHAELTTQQAADMLNVSRPFLVGLLDADEIEYRMVGTHRRIKASSLISYQRRDDARRRGAADELTALSQELGLD